jgi:hypothetical protein
MKLQSVLAGKGAYDTKLTSSCLHSPIKPDRKSGHAQTLLRASEPTSRRSSVSALRPSEAPTRREPAGNVGIEAEGKNQGLAYADPIFYFHCIDFLEQSKWSGSRPLVHQNWLIDLQLAWAVFLSSLTSVLLCLDLYSIPASVNMGYRIRASVSCWYMTWSSLFGVLRCKCLQE